MLRKTISSGTMWESRVVYSRAIRVDSQVFVSGTTATDNVTGTVVGHNDAYAQTIQALRNIEEALRQLGVVSMMLYVLECLLLILRMTGKK